MRDEHDSRDRRARQRTGHLIADLLGSGLLAFVFGVGWWVAHLDGVTTHLFRGPADRGWWHVELGDDATRYP